MKRVSRYNLQGKTIVICVLAVTILAIFARDSLCQAPSYPAAPLPIPSGAGPGEKPPPPCLKKAHEIIQKDGPFKGLDALRACAKDFPDSSDVRFWLGMTYFMTRKPDEAIAEFKEALRIRPDDRRARAMLGKVYSLQNQSRFGRGIAFERVKSQPRIR